MSIQESGVWKGGFINWERLQLFDDDEINNNKLLQFQYNGANMKECYQKNKKKGNRCLIKIRDEIIVKNINKDTIVLEIGPGRGSWTKTMIKYIPKKIFCLDVFSAEYNNFWNFVGMENKNKIEYFKVNDFLCNDLQDNSIDFLFSYDVFCHISYNNTELYLKNLYSKLKKDAVCSIMIADYDKSIKNNKPIVRVRAPLGTYNSFQEEIEDINGAFYKGRFYYYGIDKFCKLIKKYNYTIINKDIGLDDQNIICMFKK